MADNATLRPFNHLPLQEGDGRKVSEISKGFPAILTPSSRHPDAIPTPSFFPDPYMLWV